MAYREICRRTGEERLRLGVLYVEVEGECSCLAGDDKSAFAWILGDGSWLIKVDGSLKMQSAMSRDPPGTGYFSQALTMAWL